MVCGAVLDGQPPSKLVLQVARSSRANVNAILDVYGLHKWEHEFKYYNGTFCLEKPGTGQLRPTWKRQTPASSVSLEQVWCDNDWYWEFRGEQHIGRDLHVFIRSVAPIKDGWPHEHKSWTLRFNVFGVRDQVFPYEIDVDLHSDVLSVPVTLHFEAGSGRMLCYGISGRCLCTLGGEGQSDIQEMTLRGLQSCVLESLTCLPEQILLLSACGRTLHGEPNDFILPIVEEAASCKC